MHQFAIVDGAAAEGRFRHIGLAAEFGDLAQDLVVFHLMVVWAGRVGSGCWRSCHTIICPTGECGGEPTARANARTRSSPPAHAGGSSTPRPFGQSLTSLEYWIIRF